MYHCANVYCIKHLLMQLLFAGDICDFTGIKKVSIVIQSCTVI